MGWIQRLDPMRDYPPFDPLEAPDEDRLPSRFSLTTPLAPEQFARRLDDVLHPPQHSPLEKVLATFRRGGVAPGSFLGAVQGRGFRIARKGRSHELLGRIESAERGSRLQCRQRFRHAWVAVTLAALYFVGGYIAAVAGVPGRVLLIPFYAGGSLLALIFMALIWAGQWRARDLVVLIGPENLRPQQPPQPPPTAEP